MPTTDIRNSPSGKLKPAGGGGGGITPPAGQIDGTQADPLIVGITDSNGVELAIDVIADLTFLFRSGLSLIGQAITSSLVSNLSNVLGATGTVTAALNALNISGGFVAPAAAANLGATPALDFSVNRYIRGILNVDAVPTITMPTGYQCWLELQQPAAGGKVVTAWPANVDWTDGLPPTLSTGNNAKDLLAFVSDGTNLRGWAVAMNVS